RAPAAPSGHAFLNPTMVSFATIARVVPGQTVRVGRVPSAAIAGFGPSSIPQLRAFVSFATIAIHGNTRGVSPRGQHADMDIRSGTPPPRPVSRRGEPKAYLRERLSNRASRERPAQPPPAAVQAPADAGRTGSALRRAL